MNALLDTHVFLWWITDRDLLSEAARQLIADGGNTLYLSASSAWEIAIKARLGKLKISEDLERFIAEQMTVNAFLSLPIQLSHALHVYALPNHHRDPFDRMLIARRSLKTCPSLLPIP